MPKKRLPDTAPLATLVTTALAALVSGSTAGALLAEGAILVPFWRSVPPEAFLEWYAANADRLFNFFAPLEIAATLLTLVAAALLLYQRRRGGALFALAAGLSILVLTVFPLYFGEVNARFADGSIPTAEVAPELARWAFWHWLRTALQGIAFVAATLGFRIAGPVLP